MICRNTLSILTHVIGVPEGRGKEKAERIRKKKKNIYIFEEIMAKIFPKVLKSLKLQIQETQWIPSIRNLKKTISTFIINCLKSAIYFASRVAQMVKNSPAMKETWAQSLRWKIPWRMEWQPTPVFLSRESSWAEELGGLQFMGTQRVRHDWATKHTVRGKKS